MSDLVLKRAVDMLLEKSVSAAERKKDYHAGPHNSFPLGPNGEHLKAAWNLSGHAADPESVRRKIIAFAKNKGLTHRLPKSAQSHPAMKEPSMSSTTGTGMKKAKNDDVASLFHLAWNHEEMEGDQYQKRQLVRYAEEHNMQHMLPEEAHGLMHEMGVQHKHDGMKNDAETGLHHHVVTKAFNPKGFDGVILKSWVSDDGVHFEGWNATPRRDMEKDITEPEAFLFPMEGFFSRAAPLSIEHNGKSLPIGHLQKAAVVRDGIVLKECYHPSDPGEFEHFPGIGTGVWVRGIVNEEPGMSALRKGNVRGMSFIANAVEVEPLPGGRYRYLKLDPWIESTIAAYPVNPDAVIAVAKAFGLTEPPTIEDDEKEDEHMTASLEEILAEAAKQLQEEKAAEAVQGVTKADLGHVLGQFKDSLLAEVKTAIGEQVEEVKKAIPAEGTPTTPQRLEGVGRKGTVEPSSSTPAADPREEDPLTYIVEKASKAEDNTVFDETDYALLNAIIYQALVGDLKY